jgi:hypothetical protein
MQLASEVNEAIAEIGRTLQVEDTGLDFFCECGADGCLERVSMTIGAFDGLRSASQSLIADGHARARTSPKLLAQSAP